MKTNLTMKVNVDKENKQINVEREFDAPVADVWACYTQPELLDQWWAPKPWKARTKTMDFREGGYWLYAMVSPEGQEHWGRADYISIHPQKDFTAKDTFVDSEGTVNEDLPGAVFTNRFRQQDERTLVTMQTTYQTPEDLQTVLDMGVQEGLTAALENLDALLAKRKGVSA